MKEVKKRILWVDIAKALTILSVPISHTIPLEWMLRSAIFSFHMPLFFILSGFTTKLATDWKTLVKRLKKNFLYLVVPTFAIIFIFALVNSISKGEILNFFPNFGFWLHEFYIAKYPEGFYTASAIWFLLALFWAKLIMDFVNITVKSEKNGLIFLILGVIGVSMGVFEFRPPLFLDLGLVGTLFMYVGMLWRKYEKVIKKYSLLITIAAAIYWLSHVFRGDYLELWTRFYAGYEVSIIEAIAGTFLVCQFAMMFEESLKNAGKTAKKVLDFIYLLGRNTMLFYLIHCLDTTLFNIWDFRDGTDFGLWLTVFVRLGLNFSLFLIAYCLIESYKINRDKKPTKKT